MNTINIKLKIINILENFNNKYTFGYYDDEKDEYICHKFEKLIYKIIDFLYKN